MSGTSARPARERETTEGAASRRPGRAAPPLEMPAEHALLGLIVHGGGEAHGYELARHFDPAHPLGEVLRLEQAMLYQHLKKLERRGWLTMSVQPQAARPARRVYRITTAGRAELRRWLEEPVVRTREIRLEFLVKLFFALQLDPERAGRLVAEQRAVCQQLAASLDTQLAALDGADESTTTDGERGFQKLVLELRLEQTRAAIAWLERVDGLASRAPAAH
jgi:DNA-binding PadR family transcriptional regulator